LRQSHSVNYANHQHSPDGATPIFQFLAPKKLFWDLAPISVQRWKLHLPRYRLVSFMKIRSAVPENGCLVFFDGQKKKQKTKRDKKNRKKLL